MRKIFLVIILSVIVCGIVIFSAAYAALNSPWATEKLVRRAFLKSLGNVKLTDIHIARQKFFWPSHFEFGDIVVGLEVEGKVLSIACTNLELDIRRIAREGKEFDVWIDRTSLSYDLGRAENARAELKIVLPQQGGIIFQGPVSAQIMVWDRARAENVSAVFLGDDKGFYFDTLKGDAFNGSFAGGADIFLTAPVAYSVRLDLKGFDTAELATVSPEVVEQVNGRIDGVLSFNGAGDRLTGIQADLSIPSGGRVNASLLATLTQYLPETKEKKRLDALIRVGGMLSVESFVFMVKNDSPGHLAGEIKLTSKEANLNLNLTHDIYVDGTWEDLLKSWGAIFK